LPVSLSLKLERDVVGKQDQLQTGRLKLDP